jgi:hypothetical protein
MSNEWAVDLLVGFRDASTRTVTSGSERHIPLTRSKMFRGISMGKPVGLSSVLLTTKILHHAQRHDECRSPVL